MEEAFAAGISSLKTRKSTRISATLIAKRNLPPNVAAGPHDKLIEGLMKLTHVRLDREGISEIDNLEMLGPVTNLYLQCNNIKRIENLESLHHLRFLTLSGNQISRVQNLTNVTELKFLDLSENKIEDFDPGELPHELIILNMTDNPCTKLPGYRVRLIQGLPKLQQLDGVNVTKQERRNVGCVISDSEDEDDDDSGEDEVADDGEWGASLDRGRTTKTDEDHIEEVFRVSTRMIHQSRARMQKYRDDHRTKEGELEEIRSQSRLSEAFSPREVTSNLSRVSFDSPTPR